MSNRMFDIITKSSKSGELIKHIIGDKVLPKEEIDKGVKEIMESSKQLHEVWNNNNKKRAIIVSAFPGTGKSFVADVFSKVPDKIVLDSDSSKFPKEDFPGNYIKHIKENLDKADIIFVSSHDTVRNALREAGLFHILIFPERGLKQEYIERYKERGSSQAFIDLIDSNWDKWIDELMLESLTIHSLRPIILRQWEYISSRIDDIIKLDIAMNLNLIRNNPDIPYK